MDYEKLAENLIDYLLELYSPDKVCMILAHYGCTKEEMLLLDFDEVNIERGLEAVGGEL